LLNIYACLSAVAAPHWGVPGQKNPRPDSGNNKIKNKKW